jgi:N-acetylglutamate synthase-like GNAT family acetyltransferase
MVRLATLTDIDAIKEVAKHYVKELGFILRPALEEAVRREELLYEDKTNSFCHYHTRRDGVSVIYEICVPVEHRGGGIAKAMINMIPPPIQLKCPVDNESNKFYEHFGFKLLCVDPGEKRMLNVWLLDGHGEPVKN